MGKVNSHLSEEERQVIQIEVGNGTSVRKIARLLGRGYVRHQQGDQAQHVVPVQRERVLPAVPAEASEDRRGRPLLHRRPRSARPTGAGRSRASHTACHSVACGRGWTNGRVEAGRRRRSAASSAVACPNARSSNPVWQEGSRRSSTRPTTGPCACSATSRPPRHSPTSC